MRWEFWHVVASRVKQRLGELTAVAEGECHSYINYDTYCREATGMATFSPLSLPLSVSLFTSLSCCLSHYAIITVSHSQFWPWRSISGTSGKQSTGPPLPHNTHYAPGWPQRRVSYASVEQRFVLFYTADMNAIVALSAFCCSTRLVVAFNLLLLLSLWLSLWINISCRVSSGCGEV